MSNKKNTITIIGVLISATILLFGNNIIGRLFSGNDTPKKIENVPKQSSSTVNTIENKGISEELISDDYLSNHDVEDVVEGLPQKSKDKIANDFLTRHSPDFDSLIKNKKFDEAMQILEIAKSKTTQSGLLKIIKDRKRSILLMIEKDFDNVWFSFPSKLVLTEKDGKEGLYSRDGIEVIEPQYDEIDPISFEPLLLTKNEDKYGFFGENGSEIFPPIFTNVEPFYFEPLFLIEENEKSGFINRKGKIIVEPQFSRVRGREGDLIIVSKNNKWGLIDTLGHEVVEIKFDSIAEFDENGIALAKLNGEKLFIDKNGNKVKNPAFQ